MKDFVQIRRNSVDGGSPFIIRAPIAENDILFLKPRKRKPLLVIQKKFVSHRDLTIHLR
jgi:hypothetical protein